MMTDADRKRLAAILGMLGSNAAGERDNAARLAEQFRRQHGLTWEEMLAPSVTAPEIVIPQTAPEPAETSSQPPSWPVNEPIRWSWVVGLVCLWTASFIAAFGHF